MKTSLREAFALLFFAYWAHRAARSAAVRKFLQGMYRDCDAMFHASMRESPILRRP